MTLSSRNVYEINSTILLDTHSYVDMYGHT